jgi:hypothetical protein
MNIAADIYDAMHVQITSRVKAEQEGQQKDIRINQLTEELKNTKIELQSMKKATFQHMTPPEGIEVERKN